MTQIYADMLIADEWLQLHPQERKASDTTWFYEPIFNKYGYSTPDFIRSVDHYLDDPERFTEMLQKSDSLLSKQASFYEAQMYAKERAEHFQEMLAAVDSAKKYYTLYDSLFTQKDTLVDTVWFFGQHAPIGRVDFEPDSNRVLMSPLP